MDKKQMQAAIEAILFAMGDAVEIATLEKALETDKKTVEKAIEALEENYKKEERGICITRLDNAIQLSSKAECYDTLIKVAKTPRHLALTETMLETLSIIAYKQPITRAEIERIRGVSCDYQVNKLLEYRLITELGRLDAPGKPLLFGTTEQFLRSFGVEKIEDLPEMNAVQVEEFKQQAEQEIQVSLDI